MPATTKEYRLLFFKYLPVRALDPEGAAYFQGPSGIYFEYGLILLHFLFLTSEIDFAMGPVTKWHVQGSSTPAEGGKGGGLKFLLIPPYYSEVPLYHNRAILHDSYFGCLQFS